LRSALELWGYAAAVAWALPPLLCRLTLRGSAARLGIVVWLFGLVDVLVASVGGVSFLVSPAIATWRADAASGVLTQPCAAVVYRIAVVEVCATTVIVVAGLVVTLATWRYARVLHRASRRTRAHVELARLTCRRVAGLDALVLDAARPLAYALPGRPPAVVVSDAAVALLDGDQLSAVLAHERAHLTGRHHLLVALTRGLATLLPGVPLFRQAASEVARLTEICADEAAARTVGRWALVDALLAMTSSSALPRAALGATGATGAAGTEVTARVRRLEEPPDRGDRRRARIALVAVLLCLAGTLAAAVAVAIPLTGCAV
jgi:Zn-dependent protease with chaperone function